MVILKQKLSHTTSFLSLQILQKKAKTHRELVFLCILLCTPSFAPTNSIILDATQWPSFCRKNKKNYSLQFCYCICLTVKWTPIHCLRQFLGPGNYFLDLLPHSFVDNIGKHTVVDMSCFTRFRDKKVNFFTFLILMAQLLRYWENLFSIKVTYMSQLSTTDCSVLPW